MRTKSIMMSLLALSIISCVRELESNDKVEVVIRAAGNGLKSSIPVEEEKFLDINAYAYSEGVLFFDAYSKGNTISMQLDRGREYTIYLLANVGKIDPPYKEADLSELTCQFVYKSEGALPMCMSGGRKVNVDSGIANYRFEMERLVSKYSLYLDDMLENSSINITSARICQEAVSVNPFLQSSKATSTQDGDRASMQDLDLLNRGEMIDFYVLENCQGVLLEGNENPWRKVPSSIPGSDSYCTYMELSGKWTTNGASADMNIRLYLGMDNITDFNVRRNTNIQVGLSVSDDGILKSSWKVGLSNINDSRKLRFEYANNTVYQEDGWTQVPLEVYPENAVFNAEMEGGDMECKVSGGKVYVRGLYDGDLYPESTLRVSSWDGRHKSSTRILLSYKSEVFDAYEDRIPQCSGEYGYITLEKMEYPVVINLPGGTSWNIDEADVPEFQKYYDPNSLTTFIYASDSRTLHIIREGIGESAEVKVKCYKSEASFPIVAAYYPELRVNDGFVSEAGCHNSTSDGKYYDTEYVASLFYEDGTFLPLNYFKIPSEIVDYYGAPDTQAGRYKLFLDIYGLPTFSSTIPSGMVGYVSDCGDENGLYELFDSTGSLYKIMAFGLGDLPETQYAVSVKLPNADIIATGKMECVKAFPSQGFLGEVYNYQVAPGALRSYSSAVPFDAEGSFRVPPPSFLCQWSIRQTTSEVDTSLEQAYAKGSVTDYSKSVSLKENRLNFTPMSENMFPACGSMVVKGTVTNPYSRRSYTGYYRFDLVLFVSIGCQFDFVYPSSPYKIGFSYVPFCEYSTKKLASIWNEHIPDFLLVRSSYNPTIYHIKVPDSATENQWYQSGDEFKPNAMLQNVMPVLAKHKDFFEFEFNQFFSSGVEMKCTRSGYQNYPDPDMKLYSDGRKGYYHFYRQYDIANIPAVEYNKGLDNYLIEAAYGNI